MMPGRVCSIALVVFGFALAAGSVRSETLRDLHFGEALYHAHQGQFFDALGRLDAELALHARVDEPELDTLFPHLDDAHFSVGDFELHYRMHQRAGRAIQRVLEGNVDEHVRNDAAFRLARLRFQKGEPDAALRALGRIEGEMSRSARADVELLRANILMALGRNEDAIAALGAVQRDAEAGAFAKYNLAIALLNAGRTGDALEQLDRAGDAEARDDAGKAIRDKSNLVRGSLLMESADLEAARRALDRVRLSGPFSNQALLRAGWAELAAERFDRALVPWSILARRESTDAAVQEALLALPHAYSRLDIHGRAAVLYGEAVATYAGELDKLQASIAAVRDGHFLKALLREDIRQDSNWVVRLRSLPETPETFYLVELMATHAFQSGLNNHLDLEELRGRLAEWERSLAAWRELIAKREAYYTPRLPGVDGRYRKLDARMRLRLEQQRHLKARLEGLLTAPRPAFLATAEELQIRDAIEAVEAAAAHMPDDQRRRALARTRRLRGALTWRLETEYHDRLTTAHGHLRELDADVKTLEETYRRFVRTRQAATHGHADYRAQIADLRTRVRHARERVDQLMDAQGRQLETVAIATLEERRARLHQYLNQARFAFADSYDRAAKAQAH